MKKFSSGDEKKKREEAVKKEAGEIMQLGKK